MITPVSSEWLVKQAFELVILFILIRKLLESFTGQYSRANSVSTALSVNQRDVGWDFIQKNDLGELIPRLNELFGSPSAG